MKIRTTGLVNPVYNETYWASFDYKPSMEDIIKTRNEFAKAVNLKKWKGTSVSYEEIWVSKDMDEYDHPEFYKCTIDFERRYMFVFHNYSMTIEQINKYVESGFQRLPDMYHERAMSFQTNARTVKELVETIKRPYFVTSSKKVKL